MNYLDEEDLKALRPANRREELLFQAWEEAAEIQKQIERVYFSMDCGDRSKDLTKIKNTILELRPLADRLAEAWFDKDNNQPLPRPESTDPEEIAALFAFRLSELCKGTGLNTEDLGDLDTAIEQGDALRKIIDLIY